MFKKLLVFISILMLMVPLTSMLAHAEIINFAVDKANDDRYTYVQEYPELCYYMYRKYITSVTVFNPETGEYDYTPLFFSTKQTSLCIYPVPGRDGVYISKMIANPEFKPSNTIDSTNHGHTISIDYNIMVSPHKELNEKLVSVFGSTSNIKYLLDDEYGYAQQKDGTFYKAKVDIGPKVLTVYFSDQLSIDQTEALMADDTMNVSTIYIMLIAIVILICIVVAVFIYAKMKREIYKKASYY